jgi:hypothetical protein
MNRKRTLVSIAVSLALALLGSGPALADTVGYWRFEEGSGTTVADSSGNGNAGTLLDGAGHSTDAPAFGVTNTASVALDGVDDTVEIPDDAVLEHLRFPDRSAGTEAGRQCARQGTIVRGVQVPLGAYALRPRNRKQLRRRETRWGAAGGEPAVRRQRTRFGLTVWRAS